MTHYCFLPRIKAFTGRNKTIKKSLIIVLLAALLLALPLAGCKSLVKGSGELKTEDFPFDDFSRIEVKGPFAVDIADSSPAGVARNISGMTLVRQPEEWTISRHGYIISNKGDEGWDALYRVEMGSLVETYIMPN